MAARLRLLGEKRLEKQRQKPEPKVRSPKWKFKDVDWTTVDESVESSVFYRTYLGGLSLLFPEGERFFIRTVKAHLDKIGDKQLLEDVKGFIGQEVQHGKQHEVFNEKALGSRYEVKGFVNAWTGFAFGFLEKFADRFLPDSIPVSVTAAAEHFTATWAVNALTSPVFQRFKDAEVRDLIAWHAIEEIEHKHVAFDVLRSVDDSYLTRALGMVFGASIIGSFSFWGAMYLLAQEEDIDWQDYLRSLWYEVSDEQGMLRLYAECIGTYMKPGFHPSDVDDYWLAEKVAEQLEKRIAETKVS